MDVKFSTIFGFVVVRKPDWEKIKAQLEEKKRMESELISLRGWQWEQEWYEPICRQLRFDLDNANKKIEELEKYKKLYADEFQKRLELIELIGKNNGN